MIQVKFRDFKIPTSVTQFIEANPSYLKKWLNKFDNATEAYFSGRVNEDWKYLSTVLPKTTKGILDIGCGVGGIALSYAQHYPEAKITLIEQALRTQENGSFRLLDTAKDLLLSNNVEPKRCVFYDSHSSDFNSSKDKYDIIVSLRALAYSFPYDIYRTFIKEKLQPGGLLIFDVATWEDQNLAVTEMTNDPIMQNRFANKMKSSNELIEELEKTLGPVSILRKGADSVRVCVTRNIN